jgi:hypothetical protein
MSLHRMQPNTLTRREYKGKIYDRTQLKSRIRIRIRKNYYGSTTLGNRLIGTVPFTLHCYILGLGWQSS